MSKEFKSSLGKLVDIFSPKSCSCCNTPLQIPSNSYLCSKCQEKIIKISKPKCSICGIPFKSSVGINHPCPKCIKNPPYFDMAFSLFLYDGPIKTLIKNFKYHGDYSCLRALANICIKELRPIELDLEDLIIIPVPLHKNKLKKRGFNQSLLLAKRIFGSRKIASKLIIKKTDTRAQMGLSASERKKNIRGTFAINTYSVKTNVKRFLIVDDIMTTGSTVNEISKILKNKYNTEVFVFSVARTPLY